MPAIIKVIQTDITTLPVDAIVNAANNRLAGGSGVDGAIHRAAGPGLSKECSAIGGCPTGEARITKGYDLPARYVIHTVGPVWHNGSNGESGLLSSCYRSCFAIARRYNIRTIAFPAISTGVYGYPLDLSADIAITEGKIAAQNDDFEQIYYVQFSQEAQEIYTAIASSIAI